MWSANHHNGLRFLAIFAINNNNRTLLYYNKVPVTSGWKSSNNLAIFSKDASKVASKKRYFQSFNLRLKYANKIRGPMGGSPVGYLKRGIN